MKEVQLEKHEIDFRGISRPTALTVNSGHLEFPWMEEK